MRILVIAAVAVLTGCADLPTLTGPRLLPPESAAPPYDPEAFKYWSDLDGNGCHTRNEVLVRDAIEFRDKDGDGCAERYEFVAIIDPYTGQRVDGRGEIDIDHVVSRDDAWRSGAWAWDDDRREAYANDEANLLATSDDVNRAKSSYGPDRWRPPDPAAWCRYAHIYAGVKRGYQLTITDTQAAALTELRTGCGR